MQTICGGKFVLHGGNDGTRDYTPSCGNTFRIVMIVHPLILRVAICKQISLDVVNVQKLREIHLTKVWNWMKDTREQIVTWPLNFIVGLPYVGCAAGT